MFTLQYKIIPKFSPFVQMLMQVKVLRPLHTEYETIVRYFGTFKNKYDLTLCQSRLQSPPKPSFGSGSNFSVFTFVAYILIGENDE